MNTMQTLSAQITVMDMSKILDKIPDDVEYNLNKHIEDMPETFADKVKRFKEDVGEETFNAIAQSGDSLKESVEEHYVTLADKASKNAYEDFTELRNKYASDVKLPTYKEFLIAILYLSRQV